MSQVIFNMKEKLLTWRGGFNWWKESPFLEFANKPIVVAILTALITVPGTYFLNKSSEDSTRKIKLNRLDSQIAHAIGTLSRDVNSAKDLEQLAEAISKIQKPEALFTEFKDVPLDGLVLDAREIVKDTQEKSLVGNSYNALQTLRTYQGVYMKRSKKALSPLDLRDQKKLIRDEIDFNFRVRSWNVNMPLYRN